MRGKTVGVAKRWAFPICARARAHKASWQNPWIAPVCCTVCMISCSHPVAGDDHERLKRLLRNVRDADGELGLLLAKSGTFYSAHWSFLASEIKH